MRTKRNDLENSFTVEQVKKIRGEWAARKWQPGRFYEEYEKKNPELTKMTNWKRNLQRILSLSESEIKPRQNAPEHIRQAIADTFGWSIQRFNEFLAGQTETVPALGLDAMAQKVAQLVATSRNRATLVQDLLSVPINEAKNQFSTMVSRIVEQEGMDPNNFNETVHRAGMPPDPPLFPEATIQEYMKAMTEGRIPLSKAQKVVWNVATLIYPPYTNKSHPELKSAARYLAYFWNHSVKKTRERWGFSIAEDLAREMPWEKQRVLMLCWLELPLITQTGDKVLAKTGLFDLGKVFGRM